MQAVEQTSRLQRVVSRWTTGTPISQRTHSEPCILSSSCHLASCYMCITRASIMFSSWYTTVTVTSHVVSTIYDIISSTSDSSLEYRNRTYISFVQTFSERLAKFDCSVFWIVVLPKWMSHNHKTSAISARKIFNTSNNIPHLTILLTCLSCC